MVILPKAKGGMGFLYRCQNCPCQDSCQILGVGDGELHPQIMDQTKIHKWYGSLFHSGLLAFF